jgi:site-specific DNA recombinase
MLPAYEDIDDGVSGARRDRPALDRLRDTARRGKCDAIVILSPDRLARHDSPQWLLIEAFEKLHIAVLFLHPPFGDSPQGKLLTQMQGMIAEDERAQIPERTRPGRVEKARRGECMPWAYRCYGYRYLPKRHGYAPQAVIDPAEAAVVRDVYRLFVEAHLSCRHITKRLHATNTRTPTGKSPRWQTATVRNLLTNRVYAGQARDHYRQRVIPQYRKTAAHRLRSLKTGRSYRAESEWVWRTAPALISAELFAKAPQQLQRHAATAHQRYPPASGR